MSMYIHYVQLISAWLYTSCDPPSQAVQQSKWVTETEAKLRLEVLTMDSLKRLLKQASAMRHSGVVGMVTKRIRDMITAAQDWENEAKTALKQRCRLLHKYCVCGSLPCAVVFI